MFITAAPSAKPSLSPTTSIPSNHPTITGSIALVDLSRNVDAPLSSEDVIDITNALSEAYGVDESRIFVDTVYDVSGTMSLDPTGQYDPLALEESITNSIAELVGVHPSNVLVTVLDDTVHYSVKTDDFEGAESTQEILSNPVSVAFITDDIADDYPVSVDAIEVNEDVIAEVIITMDTSGAENNLEDAAISADDALKNLGYNTLVESNFL